MRVFLAIVATCAVSVAFAEEPPTTRMTLPGKRVMREEFTAPLPPPQGSTAHFASGFLGWRFNVAARGGRWESANGVFKGVENPAVKHPATACYGFDFTTMILRCEMRMHDVPLEGRPSRHMQVRTTDAKDYVCSIILNERGIRIQKDDNDHGGPDKLAVLGQAALPLKLDEWHTVVFEIFGDEMVGTVDGKSLTGRHPLIASAKHSVMFVSGGESSVRKLEIWEALPNPAWVQTRKTLESADAPAAK